MGEAYPLLAERADDVTRALADEEARFSETLNQGMELLKKSSVMSLAILYPAMWLSNSTTPMAFQ